MQHGHGDSGVPVVHALKNESSVQRQSAGGDIALANRTQNGTLTYIGEEVDQLSPGWAVLLMYLMLIMIVGAQTGLVLWRKRHKKSYELVSLTGLWLMPAVLSFQLRFWRFLSVWSFYSCVTGYLLYLSSGRKMHMSTPRKVYGWFLAAYKVSVAVGMTGYILLILDMFGVGLLLAKYVEPGLSLVLLWYGLYFGILGRDLAEMASEQMASTLGSGKRLTSTVSACGVCGGELRDLSHIGQEGAGEPVRQLACKHCFHELCIRGWTIVGKKDMCPVCLEKVDMQDLCANKPWETQNLSWIQMLDAIRYLIVWNPLIFVVITVLAKTFPTHHVTRHIAVAAQDLAARRQAPAQLNVDTVHVAGIAAGAL